ncbi:MAG: nitrous oxide reductase family maturation protein NosD [Deltaproteobacteria bacterium]|nr:nitrous oxide reductase family maturation protein NosD [Deltaproteobacteria bacterium]
MILLLALATLQVCPQCPISSVQEAVAMANAGDTIEVASGHYPEGLVLIDKPLKLTGEGKPVIDGGNQEHVFYVRADDVTIDGFVIQNSGKSYISEYAGIRAEESKNCHFTNNTFLNNTYSVYLAKVENCLIEKNEMTGNAKNEVMGGNGVHLWYSNKIAVRENAIRYHRDGIYIEFSGNSLFANNRSEKNIRYGMHFMYSNQNKYLNNIFSENQTGVAVMYSKNIEMTGNRFEKSWGNSCYGLLIKTISDSVIANNVFYADTIGLFADDSNRNRIEGNLFEANGWAVNMLGSTEENTFVGNDFINNYFDFATNSKTPLNRLESNYWSSYRGYDLNHDGLGDVAFRPMKTFSVWISHYPELVALLGSPVIEFLETAERVFPVLTPQTLQDIAPRMQRLTRIQ